MRTIDVFGVLRAPRLGGLLEDYQNEVNSFKDKLNQINPPNPGAYGYTPPPTNFPPAGSTGGTQGPSGAPGASGMTPFSPPVPNPFGAGAGPLPMSVATGGNPTPPAGPGNEPEEGLPLHQPGEVKQFSCAKNETMTPAGCRPNVPSIDYPRQLFPPVPPVSVATGGTYGGPTPPPPLPPPPPGPVTPTGPNVPSIDTRPLVKPMPPLPPPMPPGVATTGGGINAGGNSWNSMPNAGQSGQVQQGGGPAPVASVDCGPGGYWDGRSCQGTNKNAGGGRAGLISAAAGMGPSGAAAAASAGLPNVPIGGEISPTSLLGPVRLVLRRGQLGSPVIRRVRLVGSHSRPVT